MAALQKYAPKLGASLNHLCRIHFSSLLPISTLFLGVSRFWQSLLRCRLRSTGSWISGKCFRTQHFLGHDSEYTFMRLCKKTPLFVQVVSVPEVDSRRVRQGRISIRWRLQRFLTSSRLIIAHDAEHVHDVQRARHVLGDPACLVLVFFGTRDGHRENSGDGVSPTVLNCDGYAPPVFLRFVHCRTSGAQWCQRPNG